jgi:hypothetical protein
MMCQIIYTTYGENDNFGAIPFLSVTANLHKKDLGTATADVKEAIKSIEKYLRFEYRNKRIDRGFV